MQALALAISTDGINYFAQEKVAPTVLEGILSMIPPPNTINPSNIVLSGGATDTTTWTTTAESITINLSDGTLSNFTPTYQRVSQASSGVFNLYFSANGFIVDYSWYEKYNKVTVKTQTYREVHTAWISNTYNYSLNVNSLEIVVPLKLAPTTSGGYAFVVQDVVATPNNVTPHVPSSSVILSNKSYGNCFQSKLSSAAQQSLESIDFATPIQADVQSLFGTIPDSGKLLSSPSATIVYEYGVGASPLSFPANQGLTIGVTGQVTYNDASFSGEAPPTVAVPAIPPSSHLAFNMADYEFNALFWAFYEAGKLATTIVPGDLPDPSVLNTSTYSSTSLSALYSAYPSAPMSVVVTPNAAPTLTFQKVYCLSSAALTTLTNDGVPSSVLTPLGTAMKKVVYPTETAFDAKVQLHGGGNVSSYITAINQAAQTNGALVNHNVNCDFSAIPSTTSVPVFTVQFCDTYFLSNLQLGLSPSSGTASAQVQTVKFGFQIIDSETTNKLISSNLTGITNGDFSSIWKTELQPRYATVMQAMGAAGVPLPFMQGFQFLFDDAVVAVQSGYVDVVTDVEYKS